MPGNRKPRKKYVFKGMDRTANFVVLGNHSKSQAQYGSVRDLMVASLSSLRCIERGEGSEGDVHNLGFASNHSLLLAEMGMGKNLIPTIKAAQEHILALLSRIARKESITLTGPGITALRELLEIHEAQVTHPDCTEGAMRTALARVYQRQAAGHVHELEVDRAAAND